MRGTLTRSIGFIAAFLSVFLLSSCHVGLRGSLSLSVDEDGTPMVGVCADGIASQLVIGYAANRYEPVDVVAEMSGESRPLEVGDTFKVESGALGFQADQFGQFDAHRGAKIGIILRDGDSQDSLSGDFSIPEDGLTPGVWLFSDGTTSEHVCGAYERLRVPPQLGSESLEKSD